MCRVNPESDAAVIRTVAIATPGNHLAAWKIPMIHTGSETMHKKKKTSVGSLPDYASRVFGTELWSIFFTPAETMD